MTSEQNLKFAREATPLAWYEVAKLLHENATTLYMSRSSVIEFVDVERGNSSRHYTINRSVFLLAGFAMENLIKAFLIYENPSYIEGGRLSSEVKSHKLSKLQEKCLKVPYRKRYHGLFITLESGLESWARYPCGVHVGANTYQLHVTPEFWQFYNNGFMAYSRKLETLLSKTWKGPYGSQSRAQF